MLYVLDDATPVFTNPCEGNRDDGPLRSNTSTRNPALASDIAASAPAGPAPTTIALPRDPAGYFASSAAPLFDEEEVEEEAVAEVETSALLFVSNVEEDAFSVVLDRSTREVVVVVVARRGDEEKNAATTAGFIDSRFFRFVVAMPLLAPPPPRVEENERCACADMIGKDTLCAFFFEDVDDF